MIFVLLFHILGISVTSYQIMYVQILALTATSTAEIFKAAKTRLSLDDPAVIGISLNRTNIKHYVEHNTFDQHAVRFDGKKSF